MGGWEGEGQNMDRWKGFQSAWEYGRMDIWRGGGGGVQKYRSMGMRQDGGGRGGWEDGRMGRVG